jgi:hypothetical protein
MRQRRAVQGVSALVAAGVLQLAPARPALAQDAHEDVRIEQFTFQVAATGASVTCDIGVRSFVDSSSATITTVVLPGDPACHQYGNLASIEVAYTNEAGGRTSFAASGRGGAVVVNPDDVEADPYVYRSLTAEHYVHFTACDCQSPSYFTSPK